MIRSTAEVLALLREWRAAGEARGTGDDLGPAELHLELTYRCDAACRMCDVRDLGRRAAVARELAVGDYRRLLRGSELMRGMRTVVISGGEPTLRADLPELAEMLRREYPAAGIGILTNLNDPARVGQTLAAIRDRVGLDGVWLGSSLDGASAAVHDAVRGVPGSFARLREGIALVRGRFGLPLSLTFTIVPSNHHQLAAAYRLAELLGCGFGAQYVDQKPTTEQFGFTAVQHRAIQDQLDEIIADLVRKHKALARMNEPHPERHAGLWAQLAYWAELGEFGRTGARVLRACPAGKRFVMLDPYGNLAFCPILKTRTVGNAAADGLDPVWDGSAAARVRERIAAGDCSCWLLCTALAPLSRIYESPPPRTGTAAPDGSARTRLDVTDPGATGGRWLRNLPVPEPAPRVGRVLVIRTGPLHDFHPVYGELLRVFPSARFDLLTTEGFFANLKQEYPRLAEIIHHQRGRSLVRALARVCFTDYDRVVVTSFAWFPNILCRWHRVRPHLIVTPGKRWYAVGRGGRNGSPAPAIRKVAPVAHSARLGWPPAVSGLARSAARGGGELAAVARGVGLWLRLGDAVGAPHPGDLVTRPRSFTVLFVVHRYPPHGVAGVEIHTRGLARELARLGHRVTIYAAGLEGAPDRETDEDGVRIIRRWRRSPGERSREFARAVGMLQPDLIHYQHLARHSREYPVVGYAAGIPQVLTLHDYWLICPRVQMVEPDLAPCPGPGLDCVRCRLMERVVDPAAAPGTVLRDPAVLPDPVRARLATLRATPAWQLAIRHSFLALTLGNRNTELRALLDRFDAIISPTGAVAAAIAPDGKRGIRIVSHGIEAPAPAPAVGPRTPPVIGLAGVLHWHKGAHVLVAAFRQLKRPARLVLYGDCPDPDYRRYLDQLAGVAPFEFAGAYSPDAIDRVMAGIDLLAVPSLWPENYPLVVREALARGVPVVAADWPGLREAAAESPGTVFVPPGDEAALADALDRQLANFVSFPPRGGRPGWGAPPPLKTMTEYATEMIELYHACRERLTPDRASATMRRGDQ